MLERKSLPRNSRHFYEDGFSEIHACHTLKNDCWCAKLALTLKKKIAPIFGRLLSVLSESTHCLLKKTTIKTLHKQKLQSPFLCRVKGCSDAQHPLSASQATLLPRLCVIHSCWADLRLDVTSSRRPSLTVLTKGLISSTARRPPEMTWCV